MLILALSLFMRSNALAHLKANKPNSRESDLQSDTDNITRKISNAIYNTYYNPVYWKKSERATFTILKVEINKIGQIVDIRFSDSADSVFTDTFVKNINNQDFKSALTDLVKIKDYKNIAILIPIYYEPKFELHPSVDYNHIELMLKFNKKGVSGNTVFLKPVTIRVLSKGNS